MPAATRSMLHLMVVIPILQIMTGCASYAVPGAAADMRLFGVSAEAQAKGADFRIRQHLERQPLASFPAIIAVARVQAAGYRSHTLYGRGRGTYSVVTQRDVETDEQFARIATLPMVAGLAPVNRLLLPETLRDDEQLREVAARLHADLLLIYTLDTDVYLGDSSSPVDLVTLGFLPHKRPRVTTTASAALLDTRSGYLYGVAEASADHRQFANSWTTTSAIDQARRRAEAEAFDSLVEAFARTWAGVLQQQAKAVPGAARSDARRR